MAQKMDSPLSHFCFLLVLLFFMSFQLRLSVESDSIIPGERLVGKRTLTSKGRVFEMGFFSLPGNSHNYYIGIWYNYKRFPMPEKIVVWVANRDHPVSDPYTSWLELGENGILVLSTSSGLAVWSTKIDFGTYGEPPTNSTEGALGDDGNFVIRERSDPSRVIWQSFDHPTDTWLPGAKFRYDMDTGGDMNTGGLTTILRSWENTSNPATGLFSIQVQTVLPNLYEVQMVLRNVSTNSKFCCSNYVYDIYFGDQNECGSIAFSDVYIEIKYTSYPNSCLLRYVLDVTGQFKAFVWWDYNQNWQLVTKPNRGNKKANWTAMGASVLLFPMLVSIMALLIIEQRTGCGTSCEAPGGDSLKQYKHRDLRRATKNFTQKLGEGGFSTVYKGKFHGSNFIAVKELQGQLQEEKQLRAELNTVGLIQHKNLVRLRGFCLELSKKFLVYDYMQNGSLESHLFQKGTNILDWGTRYNIALGTAKGLAYLHEECRDCIIHCDIKPENILLDAEFNPKVADFGLAKLLGRNFSRVLTTMRGTRGYLAPEWFSGEPVTAKVDVFSYGQVLFEIISGRRNMDLLNDELKSYFPALVLNALNNGADVLPLADSKLEGELNVEELTRACKVAGWCIQDHEKDRPTMTQAVQILEGVLDVAIPPMPQFFQSIAEASLKEIVIKEREAYSTSSTLSTSFTFQPSAQSIQHEP